MITWSQVSLKARTACVDIKEIMMCGCLVGYMIGDRQVRHDTQGWFNEAQVDDAIACARIKEAA